LLVFNKNFNFRKAKQILDDKISKDHSAPEVALLYGRLYDQWALNKQGKTRAAM